MNGTSCSQLQLLPALSNPCWVRWGVACMDHSGREWKKGCRGVLGKRGCGVEVPLGLGSAGWGQEQGGTQSNLLKNRLSSFVHSGGLPLPCCVQGWILGLSRPTWCYSFEDVPPISLPLLISLFNSCSLFISSLFPVLKALFFSYSGDFNGAPS